jgi:hypothetical protein
LFRSNVLNYFEHIQPLILVWTIFVRLLASAYDDDDDDDDDDDTDMFSKFCLAESSWEANSHSASQEFPCLLENPKVYYWVDRNLS